MEELYSGTEDNSESNELFHYGKKRRSGRYPWGSGDNPYQHSGTWLSRVKELQKSGMSEVDIAESMGLKTDEFRLAYRVANSDARMELAAKAAALRAHGDSLMTVAKKMGYANDSSVRALLNEDTLRKTRACRDTAEQLKQLANEKGMIDVTSGVERELNISKERLKTAIYICENEGYPCYGLGVKQITNRNQQTNTVALCKPGTEYSYAYNNLDKIMPLNDYISRDDGKTIEKAFHYPESMDSSRLMIRYPKDGGDLKDGVIEIRKGVKDLDLGDSHYAQVRILVDNDRYLKGMAVYSDGKDMPKGVDVIFNTSKPDDTPMRKVLKEIKNDKDNPFGALIKEKGGQSWYEDENGNKKLSLINKKSDEGDWNDWADKIPSQFLAKQSLPLIKQQLQLTVADKMDEYEQICAIPNPTLKKKYLMDFAQGCDKDAETLSAAALPGQKYKVILPLTSVKDNEVYAPGLENGTTVALVRYPHGGTFEIPVCKVNNKIEEGRKVIGNDSKDAIGISATTAARLSGADFDGDTVQIIPMKTSEGKLISNITSTPQLEQLKGFDPKVEYAERPGMKYMKNTQNEMGRISNLITDMTLLGAPPEDIAKAVKHSMVVIDAEKHKLDYKRSEIENDIDRLRKEYQGYTDPETGKHKGGASTIISRAKNQKEVTKRVGSPRINPETGELEYKEVVEEYVDKTGKTKIRTQTSTQMKEAKDARDLVSPKSNPKEYAYADYANSMKSLANKARLEYLATKEQKANSTAKLTYQAEVDSLNEKVRVAELNAPRERYANRIANSVAKAKFQDNPGYTEKEKGKVRQQALTEARIKVGAKRSEIEITDQEWKAIQSGAVSATTQNKLYRYVDTDKLRDRVMPLPEKAALPPAKQSRIEQMRASNYTIAEIAKAVGVSPSTVQKYM